MAQARSPLGWALALLFGGVLVAGGVGLWVIALDFHRQGHLTGLILAGLFGLILILFGITVAVPARGRIGGRRDDTDESRSD